MPGGGAMPGGGIMPGGRGRPRGGGNMPARDGKELLGCQRVERLA